MATPDGTTPPGTAEEVTAAASLSAGGKTAKDLENTVLLGRGKSHLNHHGNKHFQDLIVATVDAYAKEPSVFVKRQMTLKIVEQIEEKGGFLRWSSKNGGGWETIDLEERRQKVAHALQYRIRCINNTNGGKRARAKALNAAKTASGPMTAADLLAANTHQTKKAKTTTSTTTTPASPSMPRVPIPAMAAAAVAPAPPTMVVNHDEATTKPPARPPVPSAAAAAAPVLLKKAKAKKKKPKTTTTGGGGATAATTTTTPIQLTEDERSFVRSFVNNPAGPDDDDDDAGDDDDDDDDTEYDDEDLDHSSPAAVAAQLAAVTAAVVDPHAVPMPALPGLSESAATAVAVAFANTTDIDNDDDDVDMVAALSGPAEAPPPSTPPVVESSLSAGIMPAKVTADATTSSLETTTSAVIGNAGADDDGDLPA